MNLTSLKPVRVVGKLEYDRASGDFTMALGFGASTPRVLFKTPGLKVELEAEAKSQLYITFDNHGTPTDLGILWESELKILGEAGAVKYTYGHEEGLTAGFGSGVQMKEGGYLKKQLTKHFTFNPMINK